MKLNTYSYELLKIFEDELHRYRTIYYKDYKKIDTTRHIYLEQDQTIDYYAWASLELFISVPKQVYSQKLISWQLLEIYRVTNTSLASSSKYLDPIRTQLHDLKTKLEQDRILKELLVQIDSGVIKADLVCSGHGTWYCVDGKIDLIQSAPGSTIYIYTGLGAKITNKLGAEIENEELDPDSSIVLEHQTTKKQVIDYSYPKRFSAHSTERIVPDFCLTGSEKDPLCPRVIEPKTGRVLYDIRKESKNQNYCLLSTITKRFPNRTIHWAACTSQRQEGGLKSGPYLNYKAVDAIKPRKRALSDSLPLEDLSIFNGNKKASAAPGKNTSMEPVLS